MPAIVCHNIKALDHANANGWIIVDMKKDWKEVFPAW